MKMHYKERNLANIKKLAPNTRYLAEKWHEYCEKNGIEILVYETTRTKAQQSKNVLAGKSQTMKSFHIVGQALDFVPVVGNGSTDWGGYNTPSIKKAISYARVLGFEWGGDWKGGWDQPHLQYRYKGYGTDKTLTISSEVSHVVAAPTTSVASEITYNLPNGILKRGARGEGVRLIQESLNKLYFKVGTADGIYGARTKDAVYRFQSVYANPADGIYGPRTKAAMLKQLQK
jgi:peptidoglycan LD-endopeptidase CwlK